MAIAAHRDPATSPCTECPRSTMPWHQPPQLDVPTPATRQELATAQARAAQDEKTAQACGDDQAAFAAFTRGLRLPSAYRYAQTAAAMDGERAHDFRSTTDRTWTCIISPALDHPRGWRVTYFHDRQPTSHSGPYPLDQIIAEVAHDYRDFEPASSQSVP